MPTTVTPAEYGESQEDKLLRAGEKQTGACPAFACGCWVLNLVYCKSRKALHHGAISAAPDSFYVYSIVLVFMYIHCT